MQVYYGRNALACINLAIFRKEHYLKASILDGGEEKIYATARPGYHAIARNTVDDLLAWQAVAPPS